MRRPVDLLASFLSNHVRLSRRGLMVSALAAGTIAAGARTASAVEDPIDAHGPYFAETGHNVDDPFLSRWKLAGGEKVIGIPLSEERYDEGVGVVQSFANISLVFDPGLSAPWDVQGQHLPIGYAEKIAPKAALVKQTGCPTNDKFCQFFKETGHTITARIQSFWNLNGDFAIFGMPLSEPYKESATGVTGQVFERCVLEDHGADDVRVRNVAEQLLRDAGRLGEPAFQPAPPSGGETWMVKSDGGLNMRAAPDAKAETVTVLLNNTEFIAVPGSKGDWLPGYADGFSGWVSKQYVEVVPPLPKMDPADWDPTVWQGVTLGETNVRSQPTTKADIVQTIEYNKPVTVVDWVKGEEVFKGADIWAQLDDNAYIYARNVSRNAPVLPPPLPDDAPTEGKWIDVNLTQQLMVAYDGIKVEKTVPMTSGVPGWETPPGVYTILVRVANETMLSGRIGAEHFYKLEDVLYTQYFTDEGHAIHYAWWRTAETIGRPGSHGCLNLLLEDARYFWEWADIGTLLVIHY